jgi:energy-coupling factor transport system permease protein
MQPSKFHAASWLAWALSGAAIVQLAPNPALLLLVIAVSAAVVATCATGGPLARAFPQLLAVGVAFGALRIVLLSLTTHGVGDVWFRLPQLTLPRIMGGFTLGGTIEGDVVLQAAAESLQLVALLGVFGAFNAVVAHHELVGLLPKAYHEVGLVISVALAFVPSVLTALHDVREADRSRSGGQPARRRRTSRLLIPVLERGLDRSIALSESMDARGFAHEQPTRAEQIGSTLGLGAVVAVGAAGVALVGQERVWAAVFLVAAGGTVVAAGWFSSRSRERTRYRPRRMERRDVVMAVIAGSGALLVAAASMADDASLRWGPGDGLDVSAVGLIAVLALLTPVALAGRVAEPEPHSEPVHL